MVPVSFFLLNSNCQVSSWGKDSLKPLLIKGFKASSSSSRRVILGAGLLLRAWVMGAITCGCGGTYFAFMCRLIFCSKALESSAKVNGMLRACAVALSSTIDRIFFSSRPKRPSPCCICWLGMTICPLHCWSWFQASEYSSLTLCSQPPARAASVETRQPSRNARGRALLHHHLRAPCNDIKRLTGRARILTISLVPLTIRSASFPNQPTHMPDIILNR